MRATSLILPTIVASMLCLSPVAAQTVTAPPFLSDTVRLSLSVEDWVKAETARVILVIDSAGSSGGLQRAQLLKAAEAVADRTDWRVISMDKVSDSAGLDRWRTMLETRLPEGRLAGLADRAKATSKPGLQVRVSSVRFEPTLAELEAARASLRGKLYGRAQEEMARLRTTFPDRQYRLQDVRFSLSTNFDDGPSPPPPFIPPPEIQISRPAPAMLEEAMEPVTSGGGQEDKLVMHAIVTLGAFAKP